MADEYERRERYTLDLATPTWRSESMPGSSAFVGKVTTIAPAIGKYIAVNPVKVLGAESEGAAGVLTVDTSVKSIVYVLGPNIPATGSYVICKMVEGRWVTQKMMPTSSGGGGVAVSCSPCFSIPTTITMTVTGSCAGGPPLYSDTLVYQGVFWPPYVYNLVWLSSAPRTDSTTGDTYYQFITFNGSCVLGVAYYYPTSVYGSPYVSNFWYGWYLVGRAGNSCSPFALTSGSGTGTTCSAQLT
jgi:hypothetical protein